MKPSVNWRTAVGGLAIFLVLPLFGHSQPGNDPILTPQEKELAEKATKLYAEAAQFYSMGKGKEAVQKFSELLETLRKLYPSERFKDGHPDLATSLNNMGFVLNSLGEPAKALTYFQQALAMRQKLYPPERFKDGHPDLALTLNEMGLVLRSLGEPAKALNYFEQALAMYQKLYPAERFKDGHPDLAASLNNMGFVLQSLEEPAKALTYYEQALAMRQKLYPPERLKDGHPDLATSLNNMGFVLQSLGEPAKALTYYERALAMSQKVYPAERFKDGHPDLATSLNNMGFVLQSLGEPAKALTYYEQALAMRQKLYPVERFKDGHPDLATSLNNIGFVLGSLGELAKALTFYEQALAMYQKLYPAERFKDGHPDLATSLNNMGFVLQSLGEPAKALTYYERALAMRQKLYPPERFKDGHPDLAASLNNTGFVLQSLGEPAKALTYYTQALAMYQKLYPAECFKDGHPGLAISLNNMGFVLESLREPAKALNYYELALAMRQKLYPPERFKDGHPDLALSLNNMGAVLESLGESAKALTFFEKALAMNRKLETREIWSLSEAQARAYHRAQPATSYQYLSTAVQLSPSAVIYKPVWHTRSGMLSLLQARHQDVLARLAESEDLRTDYQNLITVRQKVSRLQSEFPNEAVALKARDRQLANLNDEQDRLERRLLAGRPEFKRLREMAAKEPADLARALPKNTAFVDFIRYLHWEKGKATGQRYVAFVVQSGHDAKFLQLGDAKPIDDAVAAWRKHIVAGEESLAPAKLRELVWDKIAKELLAETTCVYMCPDGDLARLPFAALPGKKKDTILLEDYAVAIVPSGPWLLEQLLYPPKAGDGPERLLAVGDVDYGKANGAPYKSLPGTGRELKRVLETFNSDLSDSLTGSAATAATVRAKLTTERYAHFATHGYFDAKSIAEERKQLNDYLKTWQMQSEGSQRAGMGLRNPAGYVGLVLAGANDPSKAGPDGGILTGLNVVDLSLEKLRLCVLSACETGLGELTEGEGVIGLQRAFHAAGCPNVIGSLWQVDDEATAALMTQFYHELRVKKRPPLEALREAQLTIYRHPELIKALAGIGERGKIDQDASVKVGSKPPETKPGETAKTTPVRLWAAFVLSGRGE